jgi:hypothetical protein
VCALSVGLRSDALAIMTDCRYVGAAACGKPLESKRGVQHQHADIRVAKARRAPEDHRCEHGRYGVFPGVMAPWTVRNYRVHGRFVLVATNGGSTFYGRNNDRVVTTRAQFSGMNSRASR